MPQNARVKLLYVVLYTCKKLIYNPFPWLCPRVLAIHMTPVTFSMRLQ